MATSSTPPRSRATIRELVEFARAQLALLRALIRVRTTPVGELVSVPRPSPGQAGEGKAGADMHGPASASVLTGEERRELARRMELALARAARRGIFRPTCLVHSLALVDLLKRGGVPGAVIRLGVRPGEVASARAGIEAHAWVEMDGLMLDGADAQGRWFTPLGVVRAGPRARR